MAKLHRHFRRIVGVTPGVTAWYYGPLVANRLITEALYPYPRDLVIGTKLGGKRLPDKRWAPALRPEELRKGAEDDLQSLRRATRRRAPAQHADGWCPALGVAGRAPRAAVGGQDPPLGIALSPDEIAEIADHG